MSFDIKKELMKLNDSQRKAVESRAKNVLILAGAGSGKTRVLTTRISYLTNLGVEPSSILAVTFTNKAANEMKERIKGIVNSNIDINSAWIGTFHGLCNKIIAAHHSMLNLPKNYQTLDGNDQKALVRRAIEEIEEEINEKLDKKEYVQNALNFINKAKETGKRPKSSEDLLIALNLEPIYLTIYKRYEYMRKLTNTIDFGDMLLCVYELFRDYKEVREYYSKKFSHILVDEYQDTNHIQNEWIKFLSTGNYLFVVGDDDQSIYGWRGAKIENILNFDKNNRDTETVKLEQNYRSTKNILACANSVIKNNNTRYGKNLWSAGDEGSKITIEESSFPEEEAQKVCDDILLKIQRLNAKPSDFAILYRNNAISRSFEGKLTERQIPYKIIGGTSFWSRKEIKDVLAYLSLVANKENDIAFERVVNTPARGVGKKTVEKIRVKAFGRKTTMFDALSILLEENEIRGKVGNSLREFQQIIMTTIKSDISLSIYNTIIKVLEETGLMTSYSNEGEEKSDERMKNIQEMTYFAKNFVNEEDGLSDIDVFLSQAALQADSETDKNIDSLQMMTLHASKGLEFPYVYMVGVEQGIFPSKRAIESSKSKSMIEEERRLAYVGITRAEIDLSISYSGWRYNNVSGASMFISELPKEITEIKGDYGYKKPFYSNSNSESRDSCEESIKNKRKFKVGESIKHKKFGTGEILEIDINSRDMIVIVVDFGFIGRKRIMIKKTNI